MFRDRNAELLATPITEPIPDHHENFSEPASLNDANEKHLVVFDQ
jgi:hypothetical protein